jgi:hypothetical protein
MPTTTGNQQIVIQQLPDAANLPNAQVAEVGSFENRLVQRYTNLADRTARNATVDQGQASYLQAEGRYDSYDGANWVSLHPRSMFQYVRRAADAAAINNSTALVSDAVLVTTLPAVTGIFHFEDTILYSSSQTADLKVAYLFTAGTVWWGGNGLATAATATTGDGQWAIQTVSDTTNPYGGANVGTKLLLKTWGEISLAGVGTNFTLRYAQNALDATNTIPAYAGSHRKVWRVS